MNNNLISVEICFKQYNCQDICDECIYVYKEMIEIVTNGLKLASGSMQSLKSKSV